MNWQFTRGAARLFRGRRTVSATLSWPTGTRKPRSAMARLSEDPELEAEHAAWAAGRFQFNATLSKSGFERRGRSGKRPISREVSLGR
ncbi:hypothetical protein F2981_23355 (plasmid) [Sinorhizobium meliloti]|nr:hypothetical protein [Sinorhizobium meliloti]